jgi:hypothetical protein
MRAAFFNPFSLDTCSDIGKESEIQRDLGNAGEAEAEVVSV